MTDWKASDLKKLRGLAHDLKPILRIGKQGITETLLQEIRQALDHHELIKIKFIDFKEEKKELLPKIASDTDSVPAGLIGNIAILYRQNPDPEKRRILL